MTDFSRNYVAVRDLCELVKQCMKDAHRLSEGSGDIPRLVVEFERNVARLRKELSAGEVAKIIDGELAKIGADVLVDFDKVDKSRLRELIASEFRTCALYSLDRFVSVKSILRAITRARRYEGPDLLVRSSNDLSEKVGQGAHAYQSNLLEARTETSAPDASPGGSDSEKNPRSKRSDKKRRKRNALRGIYNTLAGVAFIACNTATFQMKSSAKFASEHFKAASQDLSKAA